MRRPVQEAQHVKNKTARRRKEEKQKTEIRRITKEISPGMSFQTQGAYCISNIMDQKITTAKTDTSFYLCETHFWQN